MHKQSFFYFHSNKVAQALYCLLNYCAVYDVKVLFLMCSALVLFVCICMKMWSNEC